MNLGPALKPVGSNSWRTKIGMGLDGYTHNNDADRQVQLSLNPSKGEYFMGEASFTIT